YPNITSRAGRERIYEVIAHEMAHQWFGNLVSPSDWKYLWLNESFATYFGYGIVSHYCPEWGIWEQFLNGQTNGALDRDALHETFPIEISGGEHVIINASTTPLVYSKGGSILRQVEEYVGRDQF
ncbi:MAG: M1 family aminopeptidase, partial [Desulfatiglandales bacterium]|nr:M1 family aminopeptidase [Desulfatiglandales bacterium]